MPHRYIAIIKPAQVLATLYLLVSDTKISQDYSNNCNRFPLFTTLVLEYLRRCIQFQNIAFYDQSHFTRITIFTARKDTICSIPDDKRDVLQILNNATQSPSFVSWGTTAIHSPLMTASLLPSHIL